MNTIPYTVCCVLIHLLGLVKFFFSSVENKNINRLGKSFLT